MTISNWVLYKFNPIYSQKKKKKFLYGKNDIWLKAIMLESLKREIESHTFMWY